MLARRVVFTGKQQVELVDHELPELAGDQILVQSHYSLMSTGTENIVFNRLFDEGTHWANWVKYPFTPGYATVGEIVAAGSAVTDRKVGQVVALRASHASHHVVPAAASIPVPDGVDERDATWFALAKIAFFGARAAQYQIGDSLLVIGAGPIGQMTVRWASAAGLAHIIVVDPVQTRLALAGRGGATAVIAKSVTECKEDVLAAMGGRLPRIVNDSTGNAIVFERALGLADRFGRVVLLGDTGTPSGQHLTHEVVVKGLTVVGAHDSHDDPTWNNVTIGAYWLSLVSRGKFDLSEMNTHFFKPEEVKTAYEVVNTRRGETMGVLFDWN